MGTTQPNFGSSTGKPGKPLHHTHGAQICVNIIAILFLQRTLGVRLRKAF
jgi:hypothetical protein